MRSTPTVRLHSSLLLPTTALGLAAILLGQVSARAGGRGDGGVAGGSTDCATAVAAVVGDNAFNTTSATASASIPAGGSCSAHTIYKANYFTFTPPTSASYTFSICGNASWDTRIAIMSACPGTSGATSIACDDDACSLQSQTTAALVAGTTYRVIVGGFGSSNGGAGILTIAEGSGGGGGGGGGGLGADVIVGAIPDIAKYGSVVVNGQTIMAYAIGTTSCNIGTAQLEWFAQPDNRHPFIPQNMFRHKDGRLEQIGMSWGKHGFTALQGTLCGACQASSTGNYLGIGCSDPYSAGLNGGQSGLGTRKEVNAATGIFPGTYNSGMPTAPATIGRRLQVNANDLNPSLNAGASYLVEAQYIHAQDAAGGNDNNNASWRALTVGSLSSGAYTLTLTGATIQQRAAIEAWPTFNPAVVLANVDVEGDGRFIVGNYAKDNGNGTWRYEYAVFNMNSDRSGRSFSVPIPAGVTVSNAGFRDVAYHSGDPYDLTDWSISTSGGSVTWTGGTYATNPNGNALRFSTMYNFWFDASTPPQNVAATLGLFKPGAAGAPDAMTAPVKGPSSASIPEDLNGDGAVNASDLSTLLANWGNAGVGDVNGNGSVGAEDLAALLAAWTG
ncbi:MAG: hypothetical protein LW806_03520 [Planctomycetaceae bacterium]|nr:hypothetical protein [Planctomycetaceae bacterium]